MPSGSGIDNGVMIDLDGSMLLGEPQHHEKLVFHSSYHHMNEVGMYDGWTDFSVYVRPSLAHGIHVEVAATWPEEYEDTADYIAEVFTEALCEEHEGDDLIHMAIVDGKKPMKLLIDLDWSTMECPCGQSLCGRYAEPEQMEQFRRDHAEHTSGQMLEIVTDDGVRAYPVNGKPEPVLVPLLPKE